MLKIKNPDRCFAKWTLSCRAARFEITSGHSIKSGAEKMKRRSVFPGFALLVLGLVLTAEAQVPSNVSIQSYDVGGRSVRIPSPEGFTEVLSRFKRFSQRFTGTESPQLEMLAVHIPDELIPVIAKRLDPDLDLFTKVSVSTSAKAIDMTPETFAAVATTLEKNFDKYLEPNGTVMAEMNKNADKGLDRYWKQETGTNISEPKTLGFFQKQPDLFSAMMMSHLEVLGQKRTMLSSISLLDINRRLVFVYAYKVFKSEGDLAALRDFTNKWTASILAANR